MVHGLEIGSYYFEVIFIIFSDEVTRIKYTMALQEARALSLQLRLEGVKVKFSKE